MQAIKSCSQKKMHDRRIFVSSTLLQRTHNKSQSPWLCQLRMGRLSRCSQQRVHMLLMQVLLLVLLMPVQQKLPK